MIFISLIVAIAQVLVFVLLPFLFYLIINRKSKGFLLYSGVHRTTRSAMQFAALAGFAIGGAGIAIMLVDPGIREIAAGKGTAPEQIRQLTSPVTAVILILVIALVKTALAEELLFRGFIAKKLITWLGFSVGNFLQAFMFGAIHVILFLNVPGVSPAFLAFSFIVPGASGYLAGYFNEKTGQGSIYPGWLMHGLGNLISYTFLVFINS